MMGKIRILLIRFFRVMVPYIYIYYYVLLRHLREKLEINLGYTYYTGISKTYNFQQPMDPGIFLN